MLLPPKEGRRGRRLFISLSVRPSVRNSHTNPYHTIQLSTQENNCSPNPTHAPTYHAWKKGVSQSVDRVPIYHFCANPKRNRSCLIPLAPQQFQKKTRVLYLTYIRGKKKKKTSLSLLTQYFTNCSRSNKKTTIKMKMKNFFCCFSCKQAKQASKQGWLFF
jgi:hypothetical protein